MKQFPQNLIRLMRQLSQLAGVMLFYVLWVCPQESSGQHDLFTQYKFHRLNEANGLTNNVINDMLQDTLGLIWVATEEGLFRYQGFEFQKFIREKDSPGCLHNNFVGSLYLDAYNDVWLTTDDGVSRYSYQTDRIIRFLPDKLYGRISSMAIDDSGIKYFGRHDGGILKLAGDSISRLPLFDPETGIHFSEVGIFHLAIVKDRVWAVAEGLGVISFKVGEPAITYFSAAEITGRTEFRSFELYVDADQQVWVGTNVSVYQLKIDVIGQKHVDRSLERVLPEDDYLSIYQDPEQQLWVGSRQNGMYALNKTDDKAYRVHRHFAPANDEYGISHRTVSKIFQEKTGLFWVGTHNGGINVFSPKGEAVRTVTEQLYHSAFSLNDQSVWGICESRDGTIWAGTDGKGISRLDPKTGKTINDVIPDLKDKAILCVWEDAKDRLWIGTYSSGLYVYEIKTGKIRNFNKTSPNSELLVNDIRCFYEDANGRLFVGTNQGGLYNYQESAGKIVRVKGVPPMDIRAISSTQVDFLWLGTFGSGLLKYDLKKDSLVPSAWTQDSDHQMDVIFDVYNDGRILWTATRHHGLVAFDAFAESFLELDPLKEMEGRSACGVQMDLQRNLWITTNTDILYFNRTTNELRAFGTKDGFQSGHFNFGSIFLSKSGFLVTGGIHGMNLFYAEELVTEPEQAPLILNEFRLFNHVVNPVNSDIFPEKESIFLADHLVLHPADNFFSIHFSLPGFSKLGKNDLVYKLEGYESDWQYGAESNVGTYRNVPPGQYVFRVKNLKNNVEKSIEITILPPFWKTWPAFLLYLGVLAFLIWKLNGFSNSRITLKQKLAFEQELREKEHEIMQEKLRFYTNFSHELKTPLTLIQGPVNDLLRAERDPQKRQYLQLIRKNTHVILRFVRRMLEFRKIEMNKTVLHVGCHDLKILAQEEAESFGFHARENGIRFGFYCESEVEAWVDLEKIQIVMNNLLSNAFKFTPKGKTINFGVFQDASFLYIEVKDEGVGIGSQDLESIFSPFFQAGNSHGSGGTGIGLALCKSFVELHLGAIEVESQEGKGSRFLVRIPRGKSLLEGKSYVRFIGQESDRLYHAELQGSCEQDADEKNVPVSEKVILVVDDNKDIATYIKTLFEAEFYVIEAYNGTDAYALAVQHIPDLIISDMMMPGLDGITFCRKIKEHISTSHVPVIMLTARDSKQDKINGYEAGADDYVTKPFSSELLVARVNNLLKSREMLEIRYEANDLIDPESNQNSREVEFVLKAESIILERLEHSEFSVPDICQELGMSQTSLYRKIKSLTGVSPQTFIKKIRIKRAAQLLASEDLSVSEVAFSLDFSDLKYFRKCFKEQFGMTPSDYKNAHVHKRGNTDLACKRSD